MAASAVMHNIFKIITTKIKKKKNSVKMNFRANGLLNKFLITWQIQT